ncbi:hybrid sensor histidine kinase/response regulator [Pelagibacterium limicola]|uniref:hybrid sensor histidine kinase/response regulator n=1 Tax=Pelagibacterium limicola TaxID=2791022 RepID=UPI0018AFD4C7|nr:hybrid sensor histidine kinase/response regulator [Pelagibacterium limicola]
MLPTGLAPSGFRGRLFVILICITTLPLVLTAYVFFSILNTNVAEETTAKLAFVRDAKRSEIEQYLTFAFRQAEALTKSNAVRYSIGDFYGFSYAFRQIDEDADQARSVLQRIFGIGGEPAPDAGPLTMDRDALLRNALEYSNAHQRFHEEYSSFVRSAEFDNLYLINTDGRVVYSVEKDLYLGGDVTDTLGNTVLGALNKRLLANEGTIAVADFAFDPLTGVYAAYVAVRVEFYQRPRGAAIFRLPGRGLDAIVQTQDEQSGSFFLVSSQDALVSAPETMPLGIGQHVDASDFAEGRMETALISNGLTDGAALAAWTPVGFHDLEWKLIAEVPTRIAFAKAEALTQFVLIIAAVALPVLFWLAFMLSRTMTAPLQTLTEVAESIAAGDLDRTMPNIERPTELGRLNESFKRMRDAIRGQLGLIGQKNVELERHLKLIEEKNAALEEADRLKDTFVANTSHELRTPLNGIIGISETLSAGAVGDVTPAQRSQLELIIFSARRLSRLVDDLLDLYRIRQGRMRLDIHPVHVATSIRNVLHLSEPLVRSEPVKLDVDIPETLPYVMADPVRFEQILYNLLGNAIKYTDQGSITMKAWRAGDIVSVAVIDTGIGIAPENLERIFQPLERGDAAEIVHTPGGAGLGLTIARQLATVMNGRLSAQSNVGEGSRFVLEIPVAEGALIEAEMMTHGDRTEGIRESIGMLFADAAENYGPSPDDAPLILVVDDEPINIQVLRNVLVPQGYAVRSAESGLDALAMVEKKKPDLIVLDVMMPQMGGLEVAKRLRDRYGLLDLPIIMVTARSRTRDVIAGFEHGANDYVVKPFVKDELLARIATLLEAGRARGAARENVELKHEIERRVQVEDALRLSQQRMTRLLDALGAGLVCVNEAWRVTYANQAAAVYAGRVIEAGATVLTDILTPTVADAMTRTVASEGRATLEDVPLGHASRTFLLNAFELEADAGGGIALIVAPDTDETRRASDQLVRSVQGVIDTVGSALIESGAKPPVPAAITEDADPSGRQYYRETIVSVVTQSLALWRRVTGKSKFDFAELSGVWRVNLDRSSLQARTFDKYLLIETLPANPRWRDVIQTAEFALSETEARLTDPEIAALHAELKSTATRLRDYVRENILPRPKTETTDVTLPRT